MHYVGIDVSKNKVDCLWLRDPEARKVKTKVFTNDKAGHKQLSQWLLKTTGGDEASIHVVLEPTGIYHEALAYALYQRGFHVSVINPARIHEFGKGEGAQHKTDKKDSFLLALYGFQKNPELWEPEPQEIRELKALLNRLDGVKDDLQRERNRLEKAEIARSSELVTDSLRNMIETLEAEKKRIKERIDQHIDRHPKLKNDRQLLESIPGVGEVVSRLMLAVIHSRAFHKASEVAAYLGLIPSQRESGTLRGRSFLSKAGPPAIRAKLYMPAVAAMQHMPEIAAQKARLLNNGKTKMQATCAAMRKLVQICFGVIKHQSEYRPQLPVGA
jgi:transposase